MIALAVHELESVCGGIDWRTVRRGAAVGAMTGAVGGAAIGTFAGAGVFSLPGAAIGGALGAGAGAITGAVDALAFEHWVTPVSDAKDRTKSR